MGHGVGTFWLWAYHLQLSLVNKIPIPRYSRHMEAVSPKMGIHTEEGVRPLPSGALSESFISLSPMGLILLRGLSSHGLGLAQLVKLLPSKCKTSVQFPKYTVKTTRHGGIQENPWGTLANQLSQTKEFVPMRDPFTKTR